MKRPRSSLATGLFIALLGRDCLCHGRLQDRAHLPGIETGYYPATAGSEYSSPNRDAFSILEGRNTSGETGFRRQDDQTYGEYMGFENGNDVVGRESPDSASLSYKNAATKEREARSAMGRSWGYFVISLLLFSILYSVIVMPKLDAFRANSPAQQDDMRALSAIMEREKLAAGVCIASALLLLVTGIICGVRGVLWVLQLVNRIYRKLLKTLWLKKQPRPENASLFVFGSEAPGLNEFVETAGDLSAL